MAKDNKVILTFPEEQFRFFLANCLLEINSLSDEEFYRVVDSVHNVFTSKENEITSIKVDTVLSKEETMLFKSLKEIWPFLDNQKMVQMIFDFGLANLNNCYKQAFLMSAHIRMAKGKE